MKKHSYNNKRRTMEWLHANGFICGRDFSTQTWVITGHGLIIDVKSMAEVKMTVMAKIAPVVEKPEVLEPEKESV